MPKAKARKLTAWEAVVAVERSWREKDAFIDAYHAAAKVDERGAERIRRAYKNGKLSYEEAMKQFRKIIEKKAKS